MLELVGDTPGESQRREACECGKTAPAMTARRNGGARGSGTAVLLLLPPPPSPPFGVVAAAAAASAAPVREYWQSTRDWAGEPLA